MSEITTDEFWAILHSVLDPAPIFYRLYYSDDGAPIIYSMEDIPGNYIDVDPEVYALAPFNVRVVNKKLIYVKPNTTVNKLQPSADTGTTCDPLDVCIVVVDTQPHVKWKLVNNEIS
jgi:hypothetical protein